MSFFKGKISNLTSWTITDAKRLKSHLSNVDIDLQNLFKIAAPYYQFGTGTGFSVLVYSGTGYTNVNSLGGWHIGANTFSSTSIVLDSADNSIYGDYTAGVSGFKITATWSGFAYLTVSNLASTVISSTNLKANTGTFNSLSITGSITAANVSITSSLTAGAIVGANVTSGVDPGHTHSGGAGSGTMTGSGSAGQVTYYSAATVTTGSPYFLYTNEILSVTDLSIIGISVTNIAVTEISSTDILVTTLTATNLNATATLSSVSLAGTNISGTSLWSTTATFGNISLKTLTALSTIVTLLSGSNLSGNSYSGTNLSMTGSVTALNISVTSSITGGAIVGANVTSGVDPGHTHSGEKFVINLLCGNNATLTDNTVVYWGGTAGKAVDTLQDRSRIYMPATGTITAAYVIAQSVTMGTSEAWRMSIQVDAVATSTTSLGDVTTSITGLRIWSATALNIPIEKNHYFEMVSSCPTWATNPANTRLGGAIYVL